MKEFKISIKDKNGRVIRPGDKVKYFSVHRYQEALYENFTPAPKTTVYIGEISIISSKGVCIKNAEMFSECGEFIDTQKYKKISLKRTEVLEKEFDELYFKKIGKI